MTLRCCDRGGLIARLRCDERELAGGEEPSYSPPTQHPLKYNYHTIPANAIRHPHPQFGLPDLAGRVHILKIHAKTMAVDKDIRYELLARLCPSSTGAELRSVCTEAGMFAIRGRRKSISEKDFLESINKVIRSYKKFSSTPKYMVYN